jgi:hypothetical protein
LEQGVHDTEGLASRGRNPKDSAAQFCEW